MKQISSIYLDACCLNRPFDDQTQDRIKLESEAVILILKYAKNNKLKLISSDILEFELNKTPDSIRKNQLFSLIEHVSKKIVCDEIVFDRAYQLEKFSFSSFDSLHIASAEKSKIDFFLTTDDKIIKLWLKHIDKIKIKILNPVQFTMEYLYQ